MQNHLFLFSMDFSFILNSAGGKLVIDFLSGIENTVSGKINASPIIKSNPNPFIIFFLIEL